MPRIRLWQFTSVLLIALSVGLGLAVTKANWLSEQDLAISNNLRALDNGWVHTVMLMASAVFSPIGGVTILALFTLGLGLRRRWGAALMVLVTIGGGWFSTLAIKAIIDRPRPQFGLEQGAGYPSGHVALTTAVVFAVFFLAHNVDWRDTVVVGGVMLIVLIAFSRVILGAHFLSDTIGSVLLASGVVVGLSGLWKLATVQVQRRKPAPEPS